MHTNSHLPTIAIAVLNYNGADLLRRYLPELKAHAGTDAKIVVVDNNSTDASERVVKELGDIVFWQNGKNLGYANGYNKALQSIEADAYLLINSDVRVTKGFLQPLIAMMLSGENVAAVQPKILWDQQPQYFEYAGASGGYLDKLGYPFCRGRILDHLETDKGQYDGRKKVFWTSGACMLVSAEAFHKVGGFYGYFFMHQEEIDLCWRMQLAGYHCIAEPASVVYHLGAATLDAGSARKAYYNFRNNLVMLARNMPALHMIWLSPVRLLLDMAAALHYTLQGKPRHGWAVAKGWFSFMFWLVTIGRATRTRKPFRQLSGTYSGSIIWQAYVRKRKKWSDIFETLQPLIGKAEQ